MKTKQEIFDSSGCVVFRAYSVQIRRDNEKIIIYCFNKLKNGGDTEIIISGNDVSIKRECVKKELVAQKT